MARKLPKQLESVLGWAKQNTLAVVFCAITVGVPVGAYFAADMMGEGVRQEAQRRASVYRDLASAADTNVELPVPGGEPVVLDSVATERVVQQFREALDLYAKDAGDVYAAARAFNVGKPGALKHAPVVDAAVFPNYNASSSTEAEQVRFTVADAIAEAYNRLLQQARAGMPPADAAVAASVEAAEKRYVQGELGKKSRAELDAEANADLLSHLGKVRISEYTEAAKRIALYADLSAFEVPSRASVTGLYKSPADAAAQDSALFDMQWKLWVATDVMRAFASVNSSADSVLQSPVKQLVSLKVQSLPKAASTGSGQAMAMGGGDMSGDGSGDGSTDAAPAASGGVPFIDPKQEARLDFSQRFTGRVSNGVYDVRLADVTFIAETAKLPEIFNALARENFMTVTNVRLNTADPFLAAASGYLFGPEPVSQVTMTVESVWFRDWTASHMPASVRAALGVGSAPAMGGDDGSSDGMSGF
jgi:hypothetical protein